MSHPSPPPPSHPRILAPAVVGTVYCLAAAVLYTGANVCLRALAEQACQAWVICVKEFVTVVAVGPWLAYQSLLGRPVWPPWKPLAATAMVGLTVQLGGNLGVIWALGIVGISVTIPVVTAVNLTFSALLGWFVLRESVTVRTAAAMGLLVVAIGLLHLGAGQSQTSSESPPNPGLIALALSAAGLAGVIYSVLAVTIRKNVTSRTPPATVIFVITGMGVLALAPLSLWQVGLQGLLETPPRQFAVMLLAGMLNFVAFLAISRGFRYVSVVRANILNTSQVPMAAIAGMLLFSEPPRLTVLLGIALTVFGTLLVNSPTAKQTQASG